MNAKYNPYDNMLEVLEAAANMLGLAPNEYRRQISRVGIEGFNPCGNG
jgi:hypothetical protein